MRILVADDHTLFRRGLGLLLSKLYPGVEVVEAKDFGEAAERLREAGSFDLVLLDLAMPGMEGLHGLERLRTEFPGVPMVMLSAYGDSADVLRAIELGARGYILKASSEDVLKNALSLVLSGEIYMPAGMFQGGRLFGLVQGAGATGKDFFGNLTERQKQVLELMAEGRSNKEIAKALGMLESTAKTHVKVILKKLGAANRTQAVRKAADLGWPLGRPTESRRV